MKGLISRHPVLLLLAPYVTGFLLGPAAFAGWAAAAAVRAVVRGPKGPEGSARLLATLLVAAAGAMAHHDRPHTAFGPRLLSFEGTVVDGPWTSRTAPGTFFVRVRRDRSHRPGGVNPPADVMVSGIPGGGLEPGARVAFPAAIEKPLGRRLRVRTRGGLISVEKRAPPLSPRRRLYGLRRWLKQRLDRTLSRRTAGLSASILLGIPGSVDPGTRRLFVETGTVHLLAISGLHAGIILLVLSRLLGPLAAGKKTRAAVQAAALASLCLATGGRIPVLRASLVALLHLLSSAAGRAPRPAALLMNAAFLILAVDPGAMEEISFQLSFAGYASILLYLERNPFPFSSLPRAPRRLLQTAGLSFCAWFGTAPLAAFYFGKIAWFAPLVNVAAIPLFALLLSAACCHLLAAALLPAGAALSAAPVECASGLLLRLLEACAALFPGPMPAPRPPATAVALFYILLGALLLTARPKRRLNPGAAKAGKSALLRPGKKI